MIINRDEKKYFKINASKYDKTKNFFVYRPSSINNPKNNSVIFVKSKFLDRVTDILFLKECIVFLPFDFNVPKELGENNLVIKCEKPNIEFCRFFKENNIANLPVNDTFIEKNGSFISDRAKIGKDVTIFPGVLIGSDVTIGDNVYIGSGTKIVGEVYIGNNVTIRENTTIGADGLTTDRDTDGSALTMPQFGYILIENNVMIGANVVIARGAIDATIIRKGAKIDNCVFISHNVEIGKDTFIVGETILFGSSSTGERCIISGNTTIANNVHIGSDSILGSGAVATKTIPGNSVAIGCPAKVIREKRPGEEV